MNRDEVKHAVIGYDENGDPLNAMVIDTLDSLAELSKMQYIPETVEFRAPENANFGDAALFIEQVNKLKARLAAKGFHCRIYSETVVENVWLFRYRPSKASLNEKALEDEALMVMADRALHPPILIPDNFDEINTSPSGRIRGGTNDQPYIDDETSGLFPLEESGGRYRVAKAPRSPWRRFVDWLKSWGE